MTTHRLEPTADTVVEVFTRDAAVVLTVDPGDRLVVRSLDASGYLSRQQYPGDRPARMFTPSRGHCLTGPIAVRGAAPGTHLSVELQSLRPDDWGWTVAAAADNPLNRRLGVGPDEPSWLLWELDVDSGTASNDRGFRRSIAPFLGVIGVAPVEPGEHSTVPPRTASGGNIDCRSLVAGSTLYLPVLVPGALLSVGDGHAAQGDGEVSGTAIESPVDATLALDVRDDLPLEWPIARIDGAWLTFGFDEHLGLAARIAVDGMLDLMEREHGLSRADALGLASVVVDLRVTQVVNQVLGVHAVLRDDALG